MSNGEFSVGLEGLGIILRKLYAVRGAISILRGMRNLLIE